MPAVINWSRQNRAHGFLIILPIDLIISNEYFIVLVPMALLVLVFGRAGYSLSLEEFRLFVTMIVACPPFK